MKRQTVVIGTLAGMFFGGFLAADEAEDKAIATIMKLQGRIEHDATKPGGPRVNVYLDGTGVTDAGLKDLVSLVNLRYLSLSNTELTDAGLKHLFPFKQLQSLNLKGTKVTDAGLKDLAALTQLQILNLIGTKVTNAGLMDLKKALPECQVVFSLPQTAPKEDPLPIRKNYTQEYYQAFKGEPEDKQAYTLRGRPDLARLLKYEPEGLRITVPTNYSGGAAGTGLVFHCTVQGDFEITLSFENLKPPGQNPSKNRTAKVTLGAFLDTPEDPNVNEGAISQIMDGKGGIGYSTYLSVTGEEKVFGRRLNHYLPAEGKVGRLRLVRVGAELFCYATQGADTDFTFIVKHPFRKTNLKAVFFSARTEDSNAEVDLRFTELRIRPDSLVKGQAPPSTTPTRRSMWILAILIALILIIGGFLVWWRKSRSDKKEETPQA